MRRIAATAATMLLCALVIAPGAGAWRQIDYKIVSVEGRYVASWVHDEFPDDAVSHTYYLCDFSSHVTTQYTLDRQDPGHAWLLLPGGGQKPRYWVRVGLHFRITDSNLSVTGCEGATSCAGPASEGWAHMGMDGIGNPIRMRWADVPGDQDQHFDCFPSAQPYLYISPDEREPRSYSISRLSENHVTFTIAGADTANETIYSAPLDPWDGFRESAQASWQWTIELRRVGGLVADAGGPYTVVRGNRLRLDGSQSTPRGRIDDYRWTFEPAAPAEAPGPPSPPAVVSQSPARTAQDAGCRPDRGGKRGKAPTVQPLCTIKATLTVRDGGETDSDTTTITVKPRPWETPLAKGLKPERYTRWGQPQHGTPDGATFGLNVAGCDGAARFVRDSYFCPLPDGDTWFGDGYTLNVVDDPNGPHDGYWYVKDQPKFKISRRALVNAYLYAGAGVAPGSHAPKEFYAANKDAGFPIDAFIRYVENHEGPGQGVPRSGHTQAIVEAIRNAPDANDPQRVVESVVEKTEREARTEADKRLRAAGERVCLNTRDPLAGPSTLGNPLAWDPTFQDFTPLEGAEFEGNPRDCTG